MLVVDSLLHEVVTREGLVDNDLVWIVGVIEDEVAHDLKLQHLAIGKLPFQKDHPMFIGPSETRRSHTSSDHPQIVYLGLKVRGDVYRDTSRGVRFIEVIGYLIDDLRLHRVDDAGGFEEEAVVLHLVEDVPLYERGGSRP